MVNNMQQFENYLSTCLADLNPSNVKEAMQYSLMNGGKRIRPALLFAMIQSYGLQPEIGYTVAAGIEMIHTYSLIHDDLPAMDNDTLRRGKPTCHIAYGEACAILAGDALLTQAFLQAANASDDHYINTQIVKEFVHNAGADGMVLGQIRDLEGEQKVLTTNAELEAIHIYKTGKLLILPLVCGALLAKHEEHIPVLREIGKKIGLSFQIQDDILDVTSTKEVLGKDINSDSQNNKSTYVTIMGIDAASNYANSLYEEAKQLLYTLPVQHTALLEVLDNLSKRNH